MIFDRVTQEMKNTSCCIGDYESAPCAPVESCENIGTDYAPQDQFRCSKCGIEIQSWFGVEYDDDGEELCYEYVFKYCPNCGRLIKKENSNG